MNHTAYISVGSNKGNKINNCYLAISKLRSISEILKISSFYKTDSWGYDDNFYLNFVVKILINFSPQILLNKLLFLEKKMGRLRNNSKYSSRIIDFDILFFDNLVINNKKLVIPHLNLHLRKFVLIPLLEVDSKLMCPKRNVSISDLLKECSDQSSVEKFLISVK